MLSCRQATRLVSDGLDRSLPWYKRPGLRIHLFGCRSCAHFSQVVRWLHHSSALCYEEVRLPAAARERLRRALEQASQNE